MSWIWNRKKDTTNQSTKGFNDNLKINKNYKIFKMNLNFKQINLKISSGNLKLIKKIISRIFSMEMLMMKI